MSLKKTKGIVVGCRNLGDADRIISVLDSTGLKLECIAKGILKSKRRSILATELGSLIEMDYYDKNQDVKNIKELHLVNRFDQIKNNYFGYILVQYFTELTDSFLPLGESSPELYLLLEKTLLHLENNRFDFKLLPFFKIRVLEMIGVWSGEFECKQCRLPWVEFWEFQFLPREGEILCKDCAYQSRADWYGNDRPIVVLFHKMTQKKFGRISEEEIDLQILQKADSVINTAIHNYLGKLLRSEKELYSSLSEWNFEENKSP